MNQHEVEKTVAVANSFLQLTLMLTLCTLPPHCSHSFPQVNQHEVEMTVAVADFFLQQGYRTEQVVVLTPYLGQLMELHKAFKKRDSSLQVRRCGEGV